MKPSRRVVITGASGFVGANLARALLKKKYQVFLLLRPRYNSWRIVPIEKEVIIKLVDLSDEPKVADAFKLIKPDIVFHLAAYGAYPQQNDAAQMIETNIRGTLNLVRACVQTQVKVMVNTSSSSEYGFKAYRPTENQLPTPNSDYAVSKAAATLWCRYLADKYQLYIPTLRLFSVYGPWEEPTRLMPTILLSAQKGTWPPLVQPKIARDFIYVDDVSNAFFRVVKRRGQEWAPIYNVGSGKQTTLKQLVTTVRKILSVREKPSWATMPERQWDMTAWQANIDTIKRDYGWKPKNSLRTGLQKMNTWLRNPQWQKLYRNR